MKRFLLLNKGPPTPPEASHEGWPESFRAIGDALVELGSPMANGVVLNADGSTSDDAAGLNGYSVIQVEGRGEGLDLLRDHPLLALGGEYAIEVFEVPSEDDADRLAVCRGRDLPQSRTSAISDRNDRMELDQRR